jgi:dipeptidyl aminopeptidase/acylaminoacyl peptidase
VATASDDGAARVFDATTGAELARIDHARRVRAVAFAPDGTRVATASDDGAARVFDATTGTELARIDHDSRVTAVAFAPDGTRVATGSDDHSARVFDATTGTELARLAHDAPVSAVAFAPDGTRVATGNDDHSARVFEAKSELLLARVVALMARPLDAAELRRYSLPWNSRHIEQWARYQAAEGNANAARHLVDLLLSRPTDHALSEAERYCQWLADHEFDVGAELGAIAVHRKAYDRAVALWREAAHDGNGTAAVSLALVEAVDGRVNEARALLHIAAGANIQHATTYAAIIDRTATDAEIRQLRVAADAGNAKAINFLGVGAFMAGDTDAAGDYWARSADLGDWTAPLLHVQLRNR